MLAGLLTVLAPALAGGAPAAAEEHGEPTPLTVRLTAMSPAIPTRGPVVLRGVVTNSSDEEWQDINVHPFIGQAPMTSRAEIDEATATPETAEVGSRITEVGQFASVGDLDPGETISFVVRLPRRQLQITGAPGVYWIGVHALGLSEAGRDSVADGRARTFIPLMAGQRRSASLSVVLPLRQSVRRGTDGRIVDGAVWADRLGDDGRLGRLLGVAEGAGTAPYTWLIDPAVLDAAADIAAGNPPLSYGDPRPEEEPAPSPNAVGASLRVSTTSADSADTWLDRLTASARTRGVLALPYADPDVAALLRIRPQLLERAQELSRSAFESREITAPAAFAPPAGWVSPEVQESGAAEVVLGSDQGEDVERTTYAMPGGAQLVLADRRATSRGPLPEPTTTALALRQRILADAALHALAGRTDPLTVVLPQAWDPGPHWQSAGFFPGLQRPWVTLLPLDPDPDSALPLLDGPLPYPDEERDREIGAGAVAAAGALVSAGSVLAEVLDTDNEVLQSLVGSSLSATSYAARSDATLSTLVRSRAGALESQLDAVEVLGTEFNTLSSGEGRLTVTVVNGLAHPVRLGIEVAADEGLEVTPPEELVEIGPDQRTTLRLQARADNIGVHEVVLTPVTEQGRAFGTPLEMTVRTSQVGMLIWVVLAIGGGIFVVMIIRRIVQRIRSKRWKP